MHAVFYVFVAAVCVFYVCLLLVLNKFSHVSVKGLGWLSLKKVSIDLGSTQLYVRRVGFRLNFWKEAGSPFKFIHLEVSGLKVQVSPQKSEEQQEVEDDPKDEPTNSLDSLSDLLSFSVNKRIFDFIVVDKIINQFIIHLYQTSIEHSQLKQKFVLDYIRLENQFNKTGSNRFVVTFYNGYIQNVENEKGCIFQRMAPPSKESLDNQESAKDAPTTDPDAQVKLYRNIEFTVKCDTVLSCKKTSPGRLFVKLENFRLFLSIGKMMIPLENVREMVTTLKAGKISPKPQSKSKPPRVPNLSFLSSMELKFEDFQVINGEYDGQVSNFQTTLTNKDRLNGTWVNLQIYLVSAKLFQGTSKVFELPSLTHSLDITGGNLVNVVNCALRGGEDWDKSLVLSGDNKVTITHPMIDFYYDQADLMVPYLNKKDKGTKGPTRLPLHLLKFLGQLTTKLTLVELEINVHIPPDPVTPYHRNSTTNRVVTFKLSTFVHRSSTTNYQNIGEKSSDGPTITSQSLKLKNLRMNALDNLLHINKLNSIVLYNILSNSMSVRLFVKKISMKSVNEAIFHMFRKIRNWSNTHYNRRYEEAITQPQVFSPACQDKNSPGSFGGTVTLDIFNELPSFLSSISVKISTVQADIICKDGLPSHVIEDPELYEPIDLSDFRRGVSIRLDDPQFTLKKHKKELRSSIKTVQCFTLTDHVAEYGHDLELDLKLNREVGEKGAHHHHDPFGESGAEDDTDMEDFSDVGSIDSTIFHGVHSASSVPGSRAQKVLNIHDITICNDNDEKDPNKLFLRLPEVDARVTIFLIWCSCYAASLIKSFAPTVQRRCTAQEMAALRGPSKKLRLDVLVDSVAVMVRLPTDVDVLLEVDTMRILDVFQTKSLRFNMVRGYVVHPTTHLWTRLLVVKQSSVLMDRIDDYKVESDGIRLNIPHQFLFYTVIDNVLTFFKAIKQIKHNFTRFIEGSHDFDRLLPEAKEALKFPHVHVKATNLFLTLENDPFENELSYIFELGYLAQKERMKLLDAFEEKAEKIRSESIESRIGLSSPLARDATTMKEEPSVLGLPRSSKETEKLLETAREKLNQAFSSSWIAKYRRFRRIKISSRKEKISTVWTEDSINKTMRSKFDIMNYSVGAPLFSGLFRELDLELDRARIDDLDQFIFDHAKGQPKQDYSILIPMYMSLKCRSLFMFLKDYHLPVLSFPANGSPTTDDPPPVFNLRGNIVINETLIKRIEEMRYIFVPFSPIAAPSDESDNFYSVYVPRTLTPVKFVVDLECDLQTDRACIITWCKSYEAGMSATMSAFDNFTKPQIDDSPLGWWDKMALLMHGSFRCRIANELCLHIKGSTDPYALVGMASGFVFSWRNSVLFQINGNGKHDELITVESDDFLLAIPNYSVSESASWSLMYEGMRREPSLLNTDFLASESRKYQKRVMKLTSAQKVKWKVGLLFERNVASHNCNSSIPQLCNDQERSTRFKPHYDVMVTNPAFEYHPDSYAGFRSDYLHLAISVESKGGSNTLSLTPLTFHYFFHWWNLMTKHMSLPIKQGALFAGSTTADKSSHVKMGVHLFTIKYQLILEPLTISHLYMHSTSDDLDAKNRIAFTGIKGRFDRCAIDLHQRKESLRYVNEKLNINNKILHLKMNQGAIDIDGADIRVISAIFNERSITGYLASHLGDTKGDSLANIFDLDTSSSSGESNNSSDMFANGWVDSDDFVELEQREILSAYPKVRVLPFFYSPAFSYVREFTPSKRGKYPFGMEKSHKCVLGSRNPEETQKQLVTARIEKVEHDLAHNERMLHKTQDPRVFSKLHSDIKEGKERLGVLQAVHQKLVEDEQENDKGGSTPYKSSVDKNRKNSSEKSTDVLLEPLSNNEILPSISSSSIPLSKSPTPKIEISESEDPTSNTSSSASSINSNSDESYLSTGPRLSVYASHLSTADMQELSLMNQGATQYHNRFIIHNMQLQWNNKIRDLVVAYVQRVSDRKSAVYYLSKQAVELVENLIREEKLQEERDEQESMNDKQSAHSTFSTHQGHTSCRSGEEVISSFEEEISRVAEDYEAERNYLVKLIHPQIQLTNTSDKNSCMLINSRDLELRVLSVNKQGVHELISDNDIIAGLIETRYGVLFQDSHVFVFQKDKVKSGLDKSWPPWLDLESCYDSSWNQNELVIERNSMALVYRKHNPLLFTSTTDDVVSTVVPSSPPVTSHENQLLIHLAKVVISATSKQYAIVSSLVTTLFVHGKSERDRVLERLDKVISLSDSRDFEGFDIKLRNLQRSIRDYREIFLRLESRGIRLSDSEEHQLGALELEMERMKIELFVLMKSLGSKSTKIHSQRQVTSSWSISADQVILHLLDDNREPFLDLASARAQYSRTVSLDASTSNNIQVNMIQGFNLQPTAVYPEFLRPLHDSINANLPVVSIHWKMLEPVGGISIMQHARIAVQPLQVELDYDTAIKLMDYIFPKGKKANKDHAKEHESERERDHNGDRESDHHKEVVSKVESKEIKHHSSNPFKNFIKKRVASSTSSLLSSPSSSTVASTDSDSTSITSSNLESVSSRQSSDLSLGKNTPTSSATSKSSVNKNQANKDEISLVIERASKYMSVIDLEVTTFQLMISFKTPKHLNIIDFHKLVLTIPSLRYRNKIWSPEEAFTRLRKDIIKIVLAHSGKIIGNKFKVKKRSTISQPLKQVADYANFMTVQELQEEGRSRDFGKTGSEHHHIHPHAPRHQESHRHHHHHHHRSKSLLSTHESTPAFKYDAYLDTVSTNGGGDDEDEDEDDTEEEEEEEGTRDDPDQSQTKITEEEANGTQGDSAEGDVELESEVSEVSSEDLPPLKE
ncbi:protein YPR117W [[Candida] anglica]